MTGVLPRDIRPAGRTMEARGIRIVVLEIAGGLLGQGCCTYHDPATGEEATYAFQALKARLDLDLGTVYAAAQNATCALDWRVMRAAEDGLSGQIRALDAQGNTVDIQLGARPQDQTQLTINIGVFGDKNKSIVLFEQIMGNLSEAQQAAAAPSVQWGHERRR